MGTPPKGRLPWPIRHPAITAIAIISLIPLSYLGVALWIFANFCGTTVHQIIRSPNLHRTAVIFDIDCGATTNFNTQLSIIDAVVPFSSDRDLPSLVINGPHTLYVRWLSDTKLEVSLRPYWRIYRKDDRAGDVEIRYRTADGVPWLSTSAWDNKDDYAEYTSWPPRAKRSDTAEGLEQTTQR